MIFLIQGSLGKKWPFQNPELTKRQLPVMGTSEGCVGEKDKSLLQSIANRR